MNTRELIIEKAMVLFLQRGYDQVSLDVISKEVGIKKPSLYYHFKSKEEIFTEVVLVFFKEGNEWMKSFYDPSISFKDALKDLFSGFKYALSEIQKLPFDENKGKYGYYFLLFDAMKQLPDMRQKISEAYKTDFVAVGDALKRAVTRGEVKSGIDSTALVYSVSAIIEGIFYLNTMIPDIQFDEKLNAINELIWTTIKA
jgi:AcrR family transcriptional regulator